MTRNPKSKYDWPDDQKLQALLDEHGTVETARQVGCPPSSLTRRIRKRGLRGSRHRRKPDAANGNGTQEAANSNGRPEAANPNERPEAAESNGKPEAAELNREQSAVDSNGDRGEESAEKRNPNEEPVRERTGARLDSSSRKEGESAGPAAPDEEPRSRIWEWLVARTSKEPAREPNTNKEPVQEPKPSDAVRESKPSKTLDESRSRIRESFEYLGGADYLRGRPENPAGAVGNEDTASAQRAFRPRDALAPLRRVPPPILRILAVVGLAAIAGIAAFISVNNNPKTFQRESSFAVRPSPTVAPEAVNDVLGTLAQPDSAITETIVNMLGSPRLRSFAAQSAGIPASSVGGNGAQYGWSATRRTGSTIIDMRLTGPDDGKLRAMEAAAGPEAARLVEESYTPYRLETLSAPSPPVQVGPKITRAVGLAVLLGALLGITLVLAERRLRSTVAERDGPSGAPAPRGEPWER
jgi:hypothetical protein